jgi:hypothetical protein
MSSAGYDEMGPKIDMGPVQDEPETVPGPAPRAMPGPPPPPPPGQGGHQAAGGAG